MHKNKLLFIGSIFAIFVIIQSFIASAAINQTNYNIRSVGQQQNPQFVIQTLKYEPYPVNAGDWFNVWISVQNVGQNNAPNVEFQLVPTYPFESNDSLIRDYGVIPGTISAFLSKQSLGDPNLETNQVILKYIVKTADSAPKGMSNLKVIIAPDKNSDISFTYNLPIDIANTKTDFDTVMQTSSSQGVSFAIANIGENDATAVTVTVPQQQGIGTQGAHSSIIGNLNKGDFTTVTFPILPQRTTKEITIQIAYTDTAGIRNLVNKTVSIDTALNNNTFSGTGTRTRTTSSTLSLSTILLLILGVAIGVVVMIFIQRRKGAKHANK